MNKARDWAAVMMNAIATKPTHSNQRARFEVTSNGECTVEANSSGAAMKAEQCVALAHWLLETFDENHHPTGETTQQEED